MNANLLLAVVRKDLKVVFQNVGVSVPLVAATILILVFILPGAALLAPKMGHLETVNTIWLDKAIELMPAASRAKMAGYDLTQMLVTIILVYWAAAIFPLLPLMVVTTIASDSFAGEKERKTLEALLYTPTTDWELLLGKLLSAWLPALGITWGGFLLYCVTANLAAWPVMGRLFFPTTVWLIMVLWIAPAFAAFGLGAMVLISSRARTFQAAYQLSGMVVLPCLMMFGGLLIVVVNLPVWQALLAGLLTWAIDVALLRFSRHSFRRVKLALEI